MTDYIQHVRELLRRSSTLSQVVRGRDETLGAYDGLPLLPRGEVHLVELPHALLRDASIGVLQVTLEDLSLGGAAGRYRVLAPGPSGLLEVLVLRPDDNIGVHELGERVGVALVNY